MKVAYITDIEGQWHKLADFARENPCVSLEGDRVHLNDGCIFVFGGDIIDRGPHARRLMRTFIEAKQRYGPRVVLLAGNRDINKLRLWRELQGIISFPIPEDVKALSRPEFLRWLFLRTMNTPRGLEFRAEEVAGSEEDAVDSFLADVRPGGLLVDYLLHCQLAYRYGDTLFVHGSVSEDSWLRVPERSTAADLDAWVALLNGWYAEKLDAYLTHAIRIPTHPAWNALIAYQAPMFPTRINPSSVVYNRHADAHGNPLLPSEDMQQKLTAEGIHRVVVGHSPIGDIPTVLRNGSFQWVLADNSYSPLERGARVIITGQTLGVAGVAKLTTGEQVEVDFSLQRHDQSLVGMHDPHSRYLVKAPLPENTWLLGRLLPEFKVDQVRVDALAPVMQQLQSWPKQ